MNKKIVPLLILFLYSLTIVVYGQVAKKNNSPIFIEKNGFHIKINTQNLANQKLLLYYTSGIYKTKVIIDSTQIKQNQEVVNLIQPKKIWGAIYQIQLKNQNKSLQLAVDNGSAIELKLEHTDIDSLKCLNEGPNKAFIKYQTLKDPTIEQNQQFTEQIHQKYPNSILDLYLKMDTKGHTKFNQPKANFDVFRENYLDGIPLTDDRLFLMPNLFRFMNNLVNSMPINNQNYTATIDAFLKKINCKDKAYKVMVDWFASNLVYNEAKMLEDSFKHLFEKYIDIKDCDIFGNAKLSELKNNYQGIQKIPQGATLPDYTFVNKDSIAQSMRNLYKNSDYCLLVFFSPDCPHCIENVPKNNLLLDRITQKYPKINLKRISILNDQDPKNWADFIKKSNIENWINLKDPSNKLDFQPLYNTYSNPNYIFVDKKGTVLLKTFNLKGMDDIMGKTVVGE